MTIMKKGDPLKSKVLLRCRNMATGVTFKHSNDNLTVKEFYDRYHTSLPQLIVVTQGYCGDIGLEEFSIGQVSWGGDSYRGMANDTTAVIISIEFAIEVRVGLVLILPSKLIHLTIKQCGYAI